MPGRVRTYAPCGQTPVLRWLYTRDHLSVMSGITMDGHLYTLVRAEALDSLDSVLFLQHLLPHVSAKLLVIWDGYPIHKGEVRTFLAAGGAKQILKQVELRNLCCRNLVHLRSELDLAMKRLRRKPHLITACFAGAGLPIES